MREIKFRFFDTTLKEMFIQSQIEDYTLEQINRFSSTEDQYTKVMQFTGMLDTNGVEIYEGDVVAIPECKGLKVVEWSVESCCFVLRHLPSKKYSENFYFEKFSQITVVGNIHQHAYLLGTK